LAVLELDAIGFLRIFLRQEEEYGIAHRKLIAVSKPAVLHGFSIDLRSVAALQVAHAKAIVLMADHAVAARNRRITDRQSIGRITP